MDTEERNANRKRREFVKEQMDRTLPHGTIDLDTVGKFLSDRVFIDHIKAHLPVDAEVICKVCGKTAKEICAEPLAQPTPELVTALKPNSSLELAKIYASAKEAHDTVTTRAVAIVLDLRDNELETANRARCVEREVTPKPGVLKPGVIEIDFWRDRAHRQELQIADLKREQFDTVKELMDTKIRLNEAHALLKRWCEGIPSGGPYTDTCRFLEITP